MMDNDLVIAFDVCNCLIRLGIVGQPTAIAQLLSLTPPDALVPLVPSLLVDRYQPPLYAYLNKRNRMFGWRRNISLFVTDSENLPKSRFGRTPSPLENMTEKYAKKDEGQNALVMEP